MLNYGIALDGLSGSITPGTGAFTTILGLKYANTTGYRGMVKRCIITPSALAISPQDMQFICKLAVADNTTDGTGTDSSGKIAKANSNSIASNLAALFPRSQHTVEPTTYGRVLAEGAFNGRGQLVLANLPLDNLEGDVWGKNETLGLLITHSLGSAAPLVCVDFKWAEGF